MLTTSPYASKPSLFFASEALTGLGELKISSSSSSYLDISLLSIFQRTKRWDEGGEGEGRKWKGRGKWLTVRFFVSGIQKKITMDWIPHQMVKIMYVRHPILSIETGHAN
jgi:hypothetical protein